MDTQSGTPIAPGPIKPGPISSGPGDPAPYKNLHPLSMVIGFFQSVRQGIVALVALFFAVFDGNMTYGLLAALGLIAIGGFFAWLVWSRFSYQVGTEEIRIKSGVVARNSRSIPFERIQDVSLEQKLVARLLGLATVKLETGSGGGEDGKLDALSLTAAEELRDMIRDRKAQLEVSEVSADMTADAAETTDTETPLFAMDITRLLIAGFFNFSLVILAILAALGQNLDFLIPGDFFDIWDWVEGYADPTIIEGYSLGARVVGLASVFFSLIIAGIITGMIRTFIRDYGFRIDRVNSGHKGGFRRRRGLFTLTDMVMPIHRVQAAIILTGPVRQRFGWHHLKFQSLASDASGGSDHDAAPCARREEMQPIIAETEMHLPSQGQVFRPVNSAYWWRDVAIMANVLIPVAIVGAIYAHLAMLALLLILPLAGLISWAGWRHHSYMLTEHQLFVRSGWWSRKLTILPRAKVQSVEISESPLDHFWDLSNLVIGVAGGSKLSPLKISSLKKDDAINLRKSLLAPVT